MLRARRSASRRVSSSTWRISARAVVAQLVLELAQQDLLGLAGAQPGHSLELAQLARLASLSSSRVLVEVALRGPRASARARQLLGLELERLLLARAGAPRAARSPARRARSSSSTASRSTGAGAARRPPAGRLAGSAAPAHCPRGRSAPARGRCTSSTTATATAAATSAANTISISVSSPGARGAGLDVSSSSGRLGAARHQTASAERAPSGALRCSRDAVCTAVVQASMSQVRIVSPQKRRFARLSVSRRPGRPLHMRRIRGADRQPVRERSRTALRRRRRVRRSRPLVACGPPRRRARARSRGGRAAARRGRARGRRAARARSAARAASSAVRSSSSRSASASAASISRGAIPRRRRSRAIRSEPQRSSSRLSSAKRCA